VEVTIDIDVQAMLDSRAHTEELVRDLQLTLLNAADRDAPTAATVAVIRLASAPRRRERGLPRGAPADLQPDHQRGQASSDADGTPPAAAAK
jgi:hypothetical protein